MTSGRERRKEKAAFWFWQDVLTEPSRFFDLEKQRFRRCARGATTTDRSRSSDEGAAALLSSGAASRRALRAWRAYVHHVRGFCFCNRVWFFHRHSPRIGRSRIETLGRRDDGEGGRGERRGSAHAGRDVGRSRGVHGSSNAHGSGGRACVGCWYTSDGVVGCVRVR